MEPGAFDRLVATSLLSELGCGLDAIADELIDLFDDLADDTALGPALERLAAVIATMGWWRGRVESAGATVSGATRHDGA
jgi:hypothetical protein